MKPLWIIDVSEDSHFHLQECIAFLNERHGDCWIYTSLRIDSATSISSYKTACRTLSETVSKQVNELLAKQKFNAGTFHICVIGDITSLLTRSILPFIPIFLKHNWSKVLPNHPGVGVEVGTFFHIPSQINSHNEETVDSYAAFLESLNLLHEKCMSFFYDFVIPFGDIQPIGKQVFPLLSVTQLDELIFQLLQNTYWSSLSALSILGNGNSTFGAMGAMGYFYDVDYIKKDTACNLLNQLVAFFKKKQDEYDSDSEVAEQMKKERLALFQKEGENILTDGKSLVKFIACKEMDVTEDLNKIDKFRKIHPIWHFYKSLLLPLYYLKELRYLPARLNEYLHFYKETLKRRLADTIHQKRLEQTANTRLAIDNLLETYWNNPDYQYKVISQVEEILKELLETRLEPQRDQSINFCKDEEVNPVTMPQFLQNEAEEIEATCTASSFQQLLDRMKAILQKEPTFMALLVRGIMVGTAGIFCLLPLLHLLSPHIVNFGQTSRHEVGWAAVIFVVPLLFLLICKLRRHFKLVKKIKYQLWAFILLQLKGEMKSVLSDEVNAFYEDIILYCREKLNNYERLRNALSTISNIKSARYLTTYFNRPLDELVQDHSLFKEKIDLGDWIEVDSMDEAHYYKLLKQCMLGIGYNILEPIPTENEALTKHADYNINRLLDNILSLLIEPVNAHELVTTWLTGNGSITQLQQCIDKAYPVGLFVDNTSNSVYTIFRLRYIPSVAKDDKRNEWLMDLDLDENLLFVTGFQRMEKLILSRYLNNIGIGMKFRMTFQVELTCYYAYYATGVKRGGCLGSTLVSSERLRAIDIELND